MTDQAVIVPCSRCGAKNRVRTDPAGKMPVCGKCRAPLVAGKALSVPITVFDRTFQDEVLSSAVPVLVDFWAPWCGPCKMVGPMLERLAAKYAGRVKIAKLNVDENPATASRYAVSSIPTLLFFKQGRVAQTLVGAVPESRIEDQIRALLA
ncbi:thioredoxin [Desulfosudis oleivorans]|uniref:Thioredoxin n=1 Tax=Desulfosudis oleivorans (strain DSM 6200 / JCM 39069 / Hxd3) TaxID=96561 RepID=A8ZX69_DESOH|nr:thioredoxin [Desulfosudis oleivorans]ABW68448.1 thioredoxin [Desulfosudis oleivorans Hxd3]